MVPAYSGTSIESIRAEYWRQDHLSNTRIAFSDFNLDGVIATKDDPNTTENEVEITQENHYYPFGLNQEGPWYQTVQPKNKYQYNGKEYVEDLGLNWNDYGARWYDPTVGKWLMIDPLAVDYASWSPYHYGMCNPINFIDFMGLEAYHYNWSESRYEDEKGNAVSWSTVHNSIQEQMDINAYIVDDTQESGEGFAKLRGNDLTNIIFHASKILQKNSINSISFKIKTQEEILAMRLEFFDLFISIASFWDDKGRAEGFSDVDPLTGLVSTYGRNKSSFYYFKTYVNFNSAVIKGHSNQAYAAGYLVAHEILHQLNDKAAFLATGKIIERGYEHSKGLNTIGSAVTIPSKPLNGTGFGALHEIERIPMIQLIRIKKYFLNKKP